MHNHQSPKAVSEVALVTGGVAVVVGVQDYMWRLPLEVAIMDTCWV